MRLTRAAEYAVRCMVYLAKKGQGQLASRQEVAAHAEIPAHFLAKIAQDLAKAELIEIRQGAKGGFILLKAPQTVSLLEIVETIIGEIYLNDCIARPSNCKVSYSCAVHRVWLEARDQLRNSLRKAKLDMLVREESCIGTLQESILELQHTEGSNNHSDIQ